MALSKAAISIGQTLRGGADRGPHAERRSSSTPAPPVTTTRLHTDATYAQEVAGYPGVFAHGMLTMGMTGRALTDLVGDGRLTAYGVRFTSQVWPGERLVARLTVKEVRTDGDDDLVDLDVVTRECRGCAGDFGLCDGSRGSLTIAASSLDYWYDSRHGWTRGAARQSARAEGG